MRAGLRAQDLAPSLFAYVALASFTEHVAIERGSVSAELAAVVTATRSPVAAAGDAADRLRRVVAAQDASLQTFLAFAPKKTLQLCEAASKSL